MMDPSTPRHPIRVVARRTGLSPATLRAWERRYGVVEPARSEGGQRLYSDHDLERLSTLRTLTEAGRSIGMVAELSEEAAEALLREDRDARPTPGSNGVPAEVEEWVEEAYRSILALDGPGLESTLRRASLALESPTFLDEVVTPLLARIGEGWLAGEVTPAQEHLGSGVLERVLDWLTSPAAPAPDAPSLVVATLPGERHGLGARLVSAAAVVEGWGVIYLGVDLPPGDIASAAQEVGATAVAISVVTADDAEAALRDLRTLRQQLPDQLPLFVGGRGVATLGAGALPQGVQALNGLEGLRERLRTAGV